MVNIHRSTNSGRGNVVCVAHLSHLSNSVPSVVPNSTCTHYETDKTKTNQHEKWYL